MSTHIAIIQFPGSNCEYETKRSVEASGLDASIVRWNAPLSQLESYDGYVIPGGFSYQDRVRAGAISAKLPVMQCLIDAAAQGKPILGICNGCQILAETGLIPNIEGENALEVALGHNTRNQKPVGFICDWVNVMIENPQQSVFTTEFRENTILPIPINHGEGRFIIKPEVKEKLKECTIIRYCTPDGRLDPNFPTNPNGTEDNIAGIANKQGNVLALMPHPERATFIKQIPAWTNNSWSRAKKQAFADKQDTKGPWHNLFNGLKKSQKELVG